MVEHLAAVAAAVELKLSSVQLQALAALAALAV
jgi:hypothetical protein